MQRKYYVYRHRTTTDNRVFYVGCGSEKRPYDTHHKRRSKTWFDIYENEGLIVEILHITEDKDEALELEEFLIQEYGRIIDGGSLVNKSLFKGTGGISNKGEKNSMFGKKHSEESKQKMSEAQKGDKHHMYGKPSHRRKPVLQYSKNGDFIKEWTSIYDAAQELNLHQTNICYACNGKRKSSGGFIWKYKE